MTASSTIEPLVVSTVVSAPVDRLVWIVGYAATAGLGAGVLADGALIRCSDVDAWPDTQLGSPIVVAGILNGDVLSPGTPPIPQPDPDLDAIEDAMASAIAQADAVALEPLLADDVTRRPAGAAPITRSAILVAAGTPSILVSLRREACTTYVAGMVGIVAGIEVATVDTHDGEVAERYPFLHVFVKRDGAWRLQLALGT